MVDHTPQAIKDLVNKVLTRAHALLSDRQRWTQGTLARNADGVHTTPTYDTATSWCAVGAVERACFELARAEGFSAERSEQIKDRALHVLAQEIRLGGDTETGRAFPPPAYGPQNARQRQSDQATIISLNDTGSARDGETAYDRILRAFGKAMSVEGVVSHAIAYRRRVAAQKAWATRKANEAAAKVAEAVPAAAPVIEMVFGGTLPQAPVAVETKKEVQV